MNIITEKKVNGRLIDGMRTLLTLSDEEFDNLIEMLKPREGESLEGIHFYYTTDQSECPDNPIQLGLEKMHENGKLIGRAYFGSKKIQVHDLFYQFEHLLSNFKSDSRNYNRIVKLLKTRDIDAFKLNLLTRGIGDKKLLDKVFEIFSDEETFKKFLDFENNKDEFLIDGEQRKIAEYLKCIGSILGTKNSKDQFEKSNDIYSDFYIPHFYHYQDRCIEIYYKYNMDRYTNPLYEFRRFNSLIHIHDSIIRKDEEPEWKLNPELREAVYKDFPEDSSLEEKAMYIYCKLCQLFQYDEGYFYKDKLPGERYEHTFSKEHLESIKPSSKITCWDFSRICSKMINELDGEIESVIISEGENQGHFSVGFYTDKVSAILDAINANSKGTNDLMKAKNGIELEGFKIISDRDGLIPKALEKVYPQVLGKKQISILEYMRQLKALPIEDVENNLENKMKAFVDVMRENNINGNEAIQALNVCYDTGFLGESLKRAYVGRLATDPEGVERSVLIVAKTEKMRPDTTVYSIDTQSLKLSKFIAQDVINQLNSGEIVYEDTKHTLLNIDGEGR